MLVIDKLINGKVYRNNKFLYTDKGDKRKNNLIILNSISEKNSIAIINHSSIDNRFSNSYYVDQLINFSYNGVNERLRLAPPREYKAVRSQCKDIFRTFSTLPQYNNANVYYDIRYYNEIFFRRIKSSIGVKVGIYADMLSSLIKSEQFNSYGNKTVIFLQESNFDISDISSNLNDPLKMLMLIPRFAPEKANLFDTINFVVVAKNSNVFYKFNSSNLTTSGIQYIKRASTIVNKLNNNIKLSPDEVVDIEGTVASAEIEEKPKSVIVMNQIKKSFTGTSAKAFTGEEVEITDRMEEIVEEESNKVSSSGELVDALDNNEEFLEYAEKLKEELLTAKKANANNKRNELLREEQRKIKVNGKGKTLGEILNEIDDKKIDTKKIKVKTRNSDITTSTLSDFEASYNKKQNAKDQLAILNSFSSPDREIPMYIRSIERTDSSDSFNKKETLKVVFEDENRVRHTVTVDLPKFVDNRYLYLNGGKKSLSKQLILIPIAKTAPDTVQANSNYGKKVFISRYGQKISPKIERLRKLLSEVKNPKIKIVPGDSTLVNYKYLNTLEYDELAKNLLTIELPTMKFIFNHNIVDDELAVKKINLKLKDTELPIGIKGNSAIVLDSNTNKVLGTNKELVDYLIDELINVDPTIREKLDNISIGKKYTYTRASILNQKVPLAVLLAFKVGLSELLQRAKVKHHFSEKRTRLTPEDKDRLGMIEFKDAFLYFDQYPYRNSLLLNAFQELPTKNYMYEQFNSRELYLELFYSMFGSRNIAKGFDNFMELFIDPITLEILQDLDLPTNFVDLMLYGNSLLEDNIYTRENDMAIHRVRSNELVNAILYQKLAEAYSTYKNTSSSGTPMKVSLPKDAVIKALVAEPLVEDYSILSPVRELEILGNASYKGPSGINLDQAYKLEKRSYDESMLGVLGASSPYNASVGVTRQLTYNPNILSTRGMIKAGKSTNSDLNMGNLLSPAEMLTPLAANHDDAPRIAMMAGQSKHLIPVKKTHKLLVGNGAQKTVPHILGSDFVHQAKEDGKVIAYDKRTQMMVVKYKSGEHDVINLAPSIAKNGGGGFYVSNTKSTDLKVGDSFKKDEILARTAEYFQGEKNDTEYVIGKLTKIAMHAGYYTYEDASLVTEQFCEDMASDITMRKEVVIGPNSNIGQMVKVGQKIKTGEPLMVFEQSYDEKEANMLLDKLSSDLQDDIAAIGHNVIKSKYTGVIEDIKIYYTCELEEMSPTLRKIVQAYDAEIKAKESLVKKYMKDQEHDIILPPHGKINSPDGKVKGITVGNGVLIEFFIKYNDVMNIGDKYTIYSALKSIISKKVPNELAPYSEFRKDEQVEVIMSQISVSARMVSSIWITMFANKVLVELKRKIKELY